MLSGFGHVLAGLSIRPESTRQVESRDQTPLRIDPPIDAPQYSLEATVASPRTAPASVTERTTNILDREPARTTEEI
jgi:hypothetical protein